MTHGPEFDQYAEDYDAALAKGLVLSGENKDFFAYHRIAWLTDILARQGDKVGIAMDFGCGTGSATPYLVNPLGATLVLGLDVSPKSLEVARRVHGLQQSRFLTFDQYRPDEKVDLVFCNGVFHHVPPAERAASVDYVRRSLRPEGIFAVWENNPWNPGTRLVMHRCPFDRDAVKLSARETRRLLVEGGFNIILTNYLFIFPRVLRWLRWIEPSLATLPFGAQYLVLARRAK